MREAAPWCNSFFQNLGNDIFYFLVFTQELQYEDFKIFGNQSEEKFIFILMKTKFCTRPHNLENLVLAVRKFLRPHHSYYLTTNLPISQSFFIVMWGAVEWEISKTPCYNKDELKAKIRAAFTKLNKVTVRKAVGGGDSEVAWKPWSKIMAISLNKFSL